MNKIFVITSILLGGAMTVAAQTRVEKKVATKAGGYGVTYSLPKTSLIINVEVTKTTCKAGPYYKYAEKYLGVTDAVTEDRVNYELGKFTLTNKGIPDANNTYTVEFKAGTVAPYAYLTEDGLLCCINAEYTPQAPAIEKAMENETASKSSSAVFTEELLMAGSMVRQAEVAAKQIFHIRESRMNILTGDSENLPPDGEAMKLVIKKLEDEEAVLTRLFTGMCTKETSYYDVTLIPQEDLEEEVLFRFSRKLGILDADDLGGEPIYISLKASERAPVLDPKEAEKKAKSMKGLIYNVPGKAQIEIKSGLKTLYKGEIPVVQFGTTESLAPTLFEDKKNPVKIFFYPETGAIKQIIQ
ncbi:MAG: DUF4831 family protein [Tannerella sp.]|jgi:hypothetical protein|nr:DUF4831 family protein [Tannerella sp.]